MEVKWHGGHGYSLKRHHGGVNERDIVDGVRDEPGLVVQGFCVADVVADADAPRQEQDLADGQTVVPPVVRALFKYKSVLVDDLQNRENEVENVEVNQIREIPARGPNVDGTRSLSELISPGL